MLWDRKTGEPVRNAIVWQDRRTAAALRRPCARRARPARIQRKTGLVLDAYFSGTKLQWLLDHVPGARARAEAGELAFGTIDTWLIWNLTGGRVHATDASNASRTLLFNIHTLSGTSELLRLFNIPRRAAAARACPPAARSARPTACSAAACPIAGIAGDQQAATLRPGLLRPAWPRTPMAPAASC